MALDNMPEKDTIIRKETFERPRIPFRHVIQYYIYPNETLSGKETIKNLGKSTNKELSKIMKSERLSGLNRFSLIIW